MSSGGFEWSQRNTAKQTTGDKAFGSISRHLTFPFPFFIPITLSKVQVTIPHYSGQLSHCSPTLPCPNRTSAAQNCFSPRLVEVMGYRGTLIWGIESLIWSHDFAYQSSNLSTRDLLHYKLLWKPNKIMYLWLKGLHSHCPQCAPPPIHCSGSNSQVLKCDNWK